MFAAVAAGFDEGRPGLAAWRTVQDTTNDPVVGRRGAEFRSYQAVYDYYPAGMMIWLEVDGMLAELPSEPADDPGEQQASADGAGGRDELARRRAKRTG